MVDSPGGTVLWTRLVPFIIPVHMVETINKLIRVQRRFCKILVRSPEEIGAEMVCL